jgi:hypothetical protein
VRLKSSSGGEKRSYEETLGTVLDSFHDTGISASSGANMGIQWSGVNAGYNKVGHVM